MKVETNGIMIERLQEKDIELVREWRNSDYIRNFMNFREYITPEMQKKWFESINNFNNFYFIIHYKGKKVGLGNIKNVNWEERSGEAGVFVVDKNLLGSFLPVVGALTMSSLVFDIFDFHKLYAQIRVDNKRAKKFNRVFGYKMLPGEENKESQMHILSKEDFYKSTKKFFILMKTMGFSTKNLKIVIEPVDFETDFAERIIKLIEQSPLLFDVKRTGNEIIYTEV
jgi:RimJ/RimL family protein N-acetyltransferase